MKKSLVVIAMVVGLLGSVITTGCCQSWGYRGYGMGPGMMGGYGHGYGMMGPGGWFDVPQKLSAPKSKEWAQKLEDILVMEKESLEQYQTDQDRFNVYMPYRMVIPQEEYHVQWISQLFAAYGLTPHGKTKPIVQNKTLQEAYELCVRMENDLLPRYEWLIKNAEDQQTAEVLDTILVQSRMHLAMFDHALRMGFGYGMRRGFGGGYRYGYGMGPGMMGGYGYGMGPGMMGGYGRGSRFYRYGEKSVDMKEAQTMMNDYLASMKNPNLKVGKIKDAGDDYEAEILTKENSVVDKVLIDKNTGWMRSAYK